MMVHMAQSLFSRIKEYIILFGVCLQVKWRNFIEFIRVVFRYYPTLSFFKIDTSLLLSYLFENPYRISKKFLAQRGEENIYTFGETPLTTLEIIARECGLSNRDVVYELGCGRGRTCFWLHQFVGCTVVGIDFVPKFIQKAQRVQQRFHVKGVSFCLEDLFQADLTGATAIYLYGTCYSAEEIERLISCFSNLPTGTKIITVSYSLADFQPSAPFLLIKQFEAAFTWGTTDVYLQVRR